MLRSWTRKNYPTELIRRIKKFLSLNRLPSSSDSHAWTPPSAPPPPPLSLFRCHRPPPSLPLWQPLPPSLHRSPPSFSPAVPSLSPSLDCLSPPPFARPSLASVRNGSRVRKVAADLRWRGMGHGGTYGRSGGELGPRRRRAMFSLSLHAAIGQIRFPARLWALAASRSDRGGVHCRRRRQAVRRREGRRHGGGSGGVGEGRGGGWPTEILARLWWPAGRRRIRLGSVIFLFLIGVHRLF